MHKDCCWLGRVMTVKRPHRVSLVSGGMQGYNSTNTSSDDGQENEIVDYGGGYMDKECRTQTLCPYLPIDCK
jgi:hypothetical protein